VNNRVESRSRKALRRLLVLLTALAVLFIFAYGWTVVGIDLDVPQEPLRQQNVGTALRELLSPNVFTQEYEITGATVPFQMNCPENFTPPEPVFSDDQPYIIVTPACGSSREIVTVQGFNFYPDSIARVNWIATDGERRTREVDDSGEDHFYTRGDGSFKVEIQIPQIRGTQGELHTVEAQGRFPVGLPHFSNTTGLVVEKMTETILLALIATAVSILPSAVLSFFAAHNLMRPVQLPLGNLLIMVVLLPLGWLVGGALLQPVGRFLYDVSSGSAVSITGAILIGVGSVVTTQRLRREAPPTSLSHMRNLVNTVILAVVVVAGFGLIGGLLILVSGVLQGGLLTYIGTFVRSIGELMGLLLPLIAGVAGAFALSSIGGALTRGALKHITGTMSHVVGAILGMAAGAFVLWGAAQIGLLAAWLGLFPPVVAAGLAGVVLPQLYRRLMHSSELPSLWNRRLLAVLSWIGAIIGFVVTFQVLNVRSALVEGVPPPSIVSVEFLGISDYALRALLIGGVLGAITAGLAGTRSSFPIGTVLYNTTRTILNTLRSIEPLIMGLVFVIWVGIGAFAGVLALALHSVASLGKLYSEQIESIDTGPIEALQSTGANRLQTIMYAVVPQIIPSYIAFTMYRWDINVRMSTIIGFVGGGGIGFLLQQQINLLRYRDAGVAVLAIAIVVSILDFASAYIRERAI
jgi:phosphonate ABC transporter permease subunit PhnE